MKRVIVFIAVLITITLISTGCDSAAHETAVRVVKQDGICSISVDPKIELLGIVQYLADEPNIIKNGSQYSKDISNYFSKYKSEPVISLYKDMRVKGFSFDVPPRSMLYTDDNFKITSDITLPEDIVNKTGGKDNLQNSLIYY